MSGTSSTTVVPRKRRGAELLLLVFALALALGAYAIVDLNVTEPNRPNRALVLTHK